MSDGSHRRCVRVEWAEMPSTAAVTPASGSAGSSAYMTPHGKTVVNNVISAAFASSERKALLVGGVNPKTGRTIAQTLEYDILTKQWSVPPAQSFPAPISDAAMVACGATYVLFGGWDGETINGDLWTLTVRPDGDAATPASAQTPTAAWALYHSSNSNGTNAPSPRRNHSMVASPAREDGSFTVFIFGGFDGEVRRNDLWSIDIDGHTGQVVAGSGWVRLPPTGDVPTPRDACAFAYDLHHHRLVVFGGFADTLDKNLYAFDLPAPNSAAPSASPSGAPSPAPSGEVGHKVSQHASSRAVHTWSQITVPNGPSRRQYCVGLCHGPFFITAMGHDGKSTLSQVCQLSVSEGKWGLVTFDGDEVDGRLFASSCPADGGKKLLIFGGQSKGKYVSSLLELEFEKSEVVAVAKGGKK